VLWLTVTDIVQRQRCEAFEVFEAVGAVYVNKRLWDDGDRLLAIHRALQQAPQRGLLRTFYKVYVDEVQDLTNAELALLLHMSSSGSLFLAGDPAQSVVEGVDFRFEEVSSVFDALFLI